MRKYHSKTLLKSIVTVFIFTLIVLLSYSSKVNGVSAAYFTNEIPRKVNENTILMFELEPCTCYKQVFAGRFILICDYQMDYPKLVDNHYNRLE